MHELHECTRINAWLGFINHEMQKRSFSLFTEPNEAIMYAVSATSQILGRSSSQAQHALPRRDVLLRFCLRVRFGKNPQKRLGTAEAADDKGIVAKVDLTSVHIGNPGRGFCEIGKRMVFQYSL